ncbi:MAG: hypothetical protein EPN88_02990 [Bacteroidetes bacterium]|nr:MAG: hypothetical protein EPN88_02990 [Bacteroidota bacterium]
MKLSGVRSITIICTCLINLSVNNINCFAYPHQGSQNNQNKYQFVRPPLTFTKYNGLEFRLSEPYLCYPNQSQEPDFAIALEFKNLSKDDITKLSFSVRLFDKQGKLVSESMNYCGPLTFVPSKAKTIPPDYAGVYERFCTKDKSFMDSFGKIEIELIEIGVAPKGNYDKPVFDTGWQKFEKFKGLEFRLSKPFQYLDDLSGNIYFAIAIEFKNKTNKAIKFLNFNQKVYDDQGLLVDNEVQNHNQMYEPYSMRDEKFPPGYSGINKTFYINDLNFFKKFHKIEYQLITVDY